MKYLNKTIRSLIAPIAVIMVQAPAPVFCEDWFDGEIPDISYGDTNTAAYTFAGDILTLLGGALRLAGLIVVALGIFTYLRGRYEENSGGESKGVHMIAVGIALISVIQLFKALFS